MPIISRPGWWLYLATFAIDAIIQAGPITTDTLLEEMIDLARLARWPEPAYHTIQFSSYDRRSTTGDAPGWFSNADGFGGEPIPGFLKVLRAPQQDQPGLFLLADVTGPGAIVRGWSAGMGGTLRVELDPDRTEASPARAKLVWEGPAYDFLARRSVSFLKQAGIDFDPGDAFVQQDADYLPIPFAQGLRVTWEGKLNELHFYHLQVRLYPKSTPVRTFDPNSDLKASSETVRRTIASLTRPSAGGDGDRTALAGTIEPGRSWSWSKPTEGPGAIRELRLRLQADSIDAALRGCLLRIRFDGAARPQVEAPVGDFFASGPGINPFDSLPVSVAPDGTLTSRWVMPFAKSLRIDLVNHTAAKVQLEGAVQLGAWDWDVHSMYFRAKWRADHDLAAGTDVIDLPYLVAAGQGIFVGCAAMIMNPSGAPLAGGNWWGEGDEKFLVDGETVPSTFGTGSEDYFNYSWSRPDLFDHPYCGQPLDSGPDTSGYVSNHRFQLLDAIPFERSFAGYLELWTHNRTPGLSYARIAYHYARPGIADDHRGLMPSDLRIAPLPKREPKPLGAAAGAQFHLASQLQPEATGGRLATEPCPLATQLEILQWRAGKGDRLKLRFTAEKEGRTAIRLVAVHRPDGGSIRAFLDGQPLRVDGGAETVALRTAHALRVLNVLFEPTELKAGAHILELECTEAGPIGIDYLWTKAP